jgi:hypothetical protein
MSTESNKKIVADFLATMDEGHFNAFAEDAIVSVAGSRPFSGTKSKQEMRELHAQLTMQKTGPFTIVRKHS